MHSLYPTSEIKEDSLIWLRKDKRKYILWIFVWEIKESFSVSQSVSSPAAKKALYETEHEPTSQNNIVISTLSQLINEQADYTEKLVNKNSKKLDGNSLKIEGLKKTLDFAYSEIKDTQKKMKNVDARPKDEEHNVAMLQTCVCELDTYSQRQNLKLASPKTQPKTWRKRS